MGRGLTSGLLVVSLAGFGGTAAYHSTAGAQTPQAEPSASPSYYIPPSVSPQARLIYEALLPQVARARALLTLPRTPEEFEARRAAAIAATLPRNEALLEKLGVRAVDARTADVGVVEVTPPEYVDDGTVLIHVHGGGFVMDSARSAIRGVAMMAVVTGKRVVSVDYTVAPGGKWQTVTDEVIAVYKALLKAGYRASGVGMFGDSAGGNIVAASVLKMRDQGVAMPAALVLLSPATDLTQSGDTNTTLRAADPALVGEDLTNAFAQYADRADWSHPHVSPVFGDFLKGFPPTLIQVGTKELLLSDSVRLYQAIKTSNGAAELDVYEGMSHVFQSYMTDTPEQRAAYAEAQRFWQRHLVAAPTAARRAHTDPGSP